jgi:hypothetical protein
MSNYVKSTNFTAKDTLPLNDPAKIIKGSEFDVEFNAIATAVSTKADSSSPTLTTPTLTSATLTGTPTAPTATAGTNTTQVATTAFVTAAVTAYDTALTVSTTQIENSAVTTAKIADSNVTTAKIADANITTAKIVDLNVTTGKLADNAVTTAKITDASVTPAKLAQKLTQGTAVASTSGSAVSFTGIPSWVNRITVMFNAVSTSTGATVSLRLGDSGGIETSGYTGSSSVGQYSSGFSISLHADGLGTTRGIVELARIDGNIWLESHQVAVYDSATASYELKEGAGSKTLSDTLTQLSVITSAGTFDTGSINIMWE